MKKTKTKTQIKKSKPAPEKINPLSWLTMLIFIVALGAIMTLWLMGKMGGWATFGAWFITWMVAWICFKNTPPMGMLILLQTIALVTLWLRGNLSGWTAVFMIGLTWQILFVDMDATINVDEEKLKADEKKLKKSLSTPWWFWLGLFLQ